MEEGQGVVRRGMGWIEDVEGDGWVGVGIYGGVDHTGGSSGPGVGLVRIKRVKAKRV